MVSAWRALEARRSPDRAEDLLEALTLVYGCVGAPSKTSSAGNRRYERSGLAWVRERSLTRKGMVSVGLEHERESLRSLAGWRLVDLTRHPCILARSARKREREVCGVERKCPTADQRPPGDLVGHVAVGIFIEVVEACVDRRTNRFFEVDIRVKLKDKDRLISRIWPSSIMGFYGLQLFVSQAKRILFPSPSLVVRVIDILLLLRNRVERELLRA